MAKFKEHYCYSCDGTFKLKHEMDDKSYVTSFCPFCGTDLDQDDKFSSDDVEFDDEL